MKKQKPKNAPRKVQLKEAAAVPSVYDKFDIDILAVAYNVIHLFFSQRHLIMGKTQQMFNIIRYTQLLKRFRNCQGMYLFDHQ